MKKSLMLAAWIAVGSFPAFAASAEKESKSEKKASPKIVVEMVEVDTIEPIGKGKSAPKIQVETVEVGGVITIDPNGKVDVKGRQGELPQEILDKLPKEVRKGLQKRDGQIFGKMKVIISKDGKIQEFESELGDAEGLDGFPPQDMVEILREAGEELPLEAQQALKAAAKVMKSKGGMKFACPAADPNEVSKKLDKILVHLERLEKEVQELKAQANQ